MFIKICKKYSYLFAICLVLFIGSQAHAEEELITTIILINGQAELVDVNKSGDVLKRIIAVPEYFKTSRSHGALVKKSIAKAHSLSKNNVDKNPTDYIAKVTEPKNMPALTTEKGPTNHDKHLKLKIPANYFTSSFVSSTKSELSSSYSDLKSLPTNFLQPISQSSISCLAMEIYEALAAIKEQYTFLLMT